MRENIDWSKVPLGTKMDREIADELGIPCPTVASARQRRGIKSFREVKARRADGMDWGKVSLGEKPDEVLAKELNVSPYLVTAARLGRGIPAFKRKQVRPRQHKIDWDSQPLGKKPDTVLAKEMGVSHSLVVAERRRRGITAFSGAGYSYEGYPCHSALEAMYDAYLHSTGTEHRHQVRVVGTPYIADIELGDGSLVEIAGMLTYAKYSAKFSKKLATYEAAGKHVVCLTKRDVEALYAESTLPALFTDGWRVCPSCGAKTKWFSKGVCEKCYQKFLYKRPTYKAVCAYCHKEFEHTSSRKNKYCSRGCYHKSTRLVKP